MKSFLFLLISTIFIISSYGQENDQWTQYNTASGIQIFYRYAECNNNQTDKHVEYVLLQFINTTEDTMVIDYKREMWYDNKCTTCDNENGEFYHQIILLPGEDKTADCDTKFRGAKIFSKFLNYKTMQLTKFEIKDIHVEPK